MLLIISVIVFLMLNRDKVSSKAERNDSSQNNSNSSISAENNDFSVTETGIVNGSYMQDSNLTNSSAS